MKNIIYLCCMLLIQPLFAQDAQFAVYEDAPLYLDVPGTTNSAYSYDWFLDDISLNYSGDTYFIDNVTANDMGSYSIIVDDDPTNSTNLDTLYIDVSLQELAYDSIGGAYNAKEFIVKFVEGTPEIIRDSLRNVHGATQLDTCLCDIELWYIADLIVDPENKKEAATTEPEIETVDFNYVVEANAKDHRLKSSIKPAFIPTASEFEGGASVRVAIIDTGVDQSHMNFQNAFWTNPDESDPDGDTDENCLIGDIAGYDFIDDDAEPSDTRWKHATHLAGLVDSISFDQAQIMNLKIFSIQTKSTLFPGVCATYYAATKDAQIINMSWGWQGLPAKILKNAIGFSGEECGALVICSAGNKGTNNDSIPHYPSGYDLNNVLQVGAYELNEAFIPVKTEYSNYGNSVDVVVPGFWWSTVPGNTTDTLQGTSMAAAAMTGMAARLLAVNPEITWSEVKSCLINSASFSQELQADSLKGYWFSPATMGSNAVECIASSDSPKDCQEVFQVSIPIFESLELGDLSISPIPFNNWINFELDIENTGDVIFEIYDISGRQIHTEKIWMSSGEQKINWNGSHLPKGMYVCYIHNDKQHFSGKMVK